MDFNRGNNQAPASRPSQSVGLDNSASVASSNKYKGSPKKMGLMKAGAFALLLCMVVIVAALALLFNFGDNQESKAILTNKLQSVFLNNGQVYFGNIKTLNNKYLDLTNIYYLRTNSTGTAATTATSANDVSLVKLGCELHRPYDEMIINRDQVTFWENLQDSGQVAKAIAQFKQQNPHGQNCSTTTNNGTQQAPSATTPTNTGVTPTPTPAVTRKP